jgi:Tfp pilus assembly protein PilF
MDMIAFKNTKRVSEILVGSIVVLLIISTAEGRQARGRDQSTRANNKGQSTQQAAAPASKGTVATQPSQRDTRSAPDSTRVVPAEKAQVSNRPDPRPGQSDASGSDRPSERSIAARRNFDQPATSRQQSPDSDARSVPRVVREDMSPPIQRPQPQIEQTRAAEAPAVSPPSAGDAGGQRRNFISPIVRSPIRVQPQVQQNQTTVGAVKSEASAPRVASVERRHIVTPATSSGQTAKASVQSKVAASAPSRVVRNVSRDERPEIAEGQGQNNSTKVVNGAQRRERILRGTAGKEVTLPSTGKLMNVEKAVNAVDARPTRRSTRNDTAIVNNSKTVVNNYGGHRDGHGDNDSWRWNNKHSDHDGGWWNKHHNDHHSNFFVSFGFYGGYSYCSWAPIIYDPVYTPVWDPFISYEPAFCTTVAYSTGPCGYRPIVYNCGPRYAVSYVYPGYHRRYIFVSAGGYWPCYPYARYYWYGCHPWYWYGAAPVAYQVGSGDTNYYTYNYYGTDSSSGGALEPGSVVNGVEVPDYDALSKVGRQVSVPPLMPPQLPAQLPAPEKPSAPTESDQLFDEGVNAFADANYAAAIEKFRRAVRLEPNDVILPFAYAQALFANNDYEQAAAVLHTALGAMAPAKPEVFFPRGLYKDDAVLTAQIRNLERAVMMNPTNPELQLLYGYELLGIGKLDEAKTPLEVAKRDVRTAGPAASLLNLIERVKQESQQPQIEKP